MDVTPRTASRAPRWLVLLGAALVAVLVAVAFQTPPPAGNDTDVREVVVTHDATVRHLAGLHPWWSPPGDVFQVPEFHEGRHVVTSRFVDAAERLGVGVQVWTVNEAEQMHRLLDAGVHGIMTDVPDRLVEVLDARAGQCCC